MQVVKNKLKTKIILVISNFITLTLTNKLFNLKILTLQIDYLQYYIFVDFK